ncbi:MAG: ATP-binding cassette domain-containing protein [Candidatus Heimdallarchaeaceae archaeon]
MYKGTGETIAFRGIELRKKNEKLYLKGKSGSGKSTLLYCLAGLLIPSSGRIFINNDDIAKFTIEELVKLKLQLHFGIEHQFYVMINNNSLVLTFYLG